jgi:hypothetical protein
MVDTVDGLVAVVDDILLRAKASEPHVQRHMDACLVHLKHWLRRVTMHESRPMPLEFFCCSMPSSCQALLAEKPASICIESQSTACHGPIAKVWSQPT